MSRPIVVFEDDRWVHFLPLVYGRGLFELRCGQGMLRERIARLTRLQEAAGPGPSVAAGPEPAELGVHLWCRPQLAEVVREQTGEPVGQPVDGPALFLNGRGFWRELPPAEDPQPWVGVCGGDQTACLSADAALAAQLSPEVFLDPARLAGVIAGVPRRDVSSRVDLFEWPWQVVLGNARAILEDWELSRNEGSAVPEDSAVPEGSAFPGVHLLNPGCIRIGAGTRIKPGVVIDAEQGPVWIGERVTIAPHAYIEGPAVIGDDSLIQPRAVLREGTTLGPRCKVGGEVEAAVLHGYTNKQHDGFLGHSYLGSWVNIGADCLNSDLKNTYGTIRVPINGREVETGEQFVGLLMGDHSKTGINVAFPTGAVVGFCSNVVTPRAPKFVPSFTWMDADAAQPFDLERGLEVARRMMSRRDRSLSTAAEVLFRSIAALAREIEAVRVER